MINSMTAFASANSQESLGSINWEIRSVNHRFLDCSIKLPDSFKGLEVELRDILRQKIQRGRLECSLQYRSTGLGGESTNINSKLLQELAIATNSIRQFFPDAKSPNALQVLGWPGILQTNEESLTTLQKAVITLFTQAVAKLIEHREREGMMLQQLLLTKLQAIAACTQQIKERFPTIITLQRAKLAAKLQEIQDGRAVLDPNRLEQEMVFFAQKIDICEEVERLETHIKEMQHVLQPVQKKAATSAATQNQCGRRLDFLLQEFNREANTIASKSVDSETTKITLDIKVLIEQMREQVQNIE